ncbi:hypothetical protein E2562_015124 [Oryza meyeriana var. granulata]|uniref:Uncharacterized protein n=1 Tax=Oryza meyeriana var. granulata TaxID=110450 RepID=A0A6G1DZ43_9ORYZ|nr:hypothetical protein E2562_015124 [Oryza meyeriana var. granulata]
MAVSGGSATAREEGLVQIKPWRLGCPLEVIVGAPRRPGCRYAASTAEGRGRSVGGGPHEEAEKAYLLGDRVGHWPMDLPHPCGKAENDFLAQIEDPTGRGSFMVIKLDFFMMRSLRH